MRNSFGSKVRRLAFKHRTCNKEEWQAANLHRFQEPKRC